MLFRSTHKNDEITVSCLDDPGSLCIVKDWISTGCFPMDMIMGGGFPLGRVTEIFGSEATGKSLLATQAVLAGQARDALCVFADVESAVSKPLMEKLGVDTKKLIYFTPDTVDQLFGRLVEIIDAKNKRLGLDHPMVFVWDSIAATTTLAEQEETDLDKRMYASAAPQISRAMRVIARQIARSNVAAIFTNQLKAKLGVMFGDKDATFGGKAIAFHASVRLKLTAGQKIKRGERRIGIWMGVEVKKNKVAAPYGTCTVPIYFDYGIDEDESILEMGKKFGVIKASAQSYEVVGLNAEPIKVSKKAWRDWMSENYNEVCDMLQEVYDRDGTVQ